MAKTKTKKPKRSEVLWDAYLTEVQREQEDSKPAQGNGLKVFDSFLGIGIAIVFLALLVGWMSDRSQSTTQPVQQVEVGQ